MKLVNNTSMRFIKSFEYKNVQVSMKMLNISNSYIVYVNNKAYTNFLKKNDADREFEQAVTILQST